MLIYSPKHKLNIFIEYINCLLLEEKGDELKTWDGGKEIIINDEHDIIIFLQVVPNHENTIILKNTKKVNIIICNTEQLTSNCNAFIFNVEPFFEYCKNKNVEIFVADYSEQNIKIIKENTFIQENKINCYYLPYQYNKKEIDFLKSESTKEKKLITCGCQTDRRKQIREDLLENHGLKIDVANGFYDARDKFMMKYKILVNISTKDEFTIYEHIRCDRLLFAGMVIISEHKTDEDLLDISEFIIWCNKEELSEKIEEVLLNYDYYSKKITQEKINIISNKRRDIYNNFRKNMEIK
jgi:hypothetical protein